MKFIEVDVDYVDDECDLDEVDVDDVGDVKKCRRCCVDEVTISIWQQFFGNKKNFAGACGKNEQQDVTTSAASALFRANTGRLFKSLGFQPSGWLFWASGDSPARKSHPPKSIPSWQTSVPKGKWLNFGSTSTHQKSLGICLNDG